LEVKAVTTTLMELAVDAVIIGIAQGDKALSGSATWIDAALDGALGKALVNGEATGKLGELTQFNTLGRIPAGRVIMLGLGKKSELVSDRLRRASGEVARVSRKVQARRIAFGLPAGMNRLEAGEAAQSIVEGVMLGLYNFRKYITSEPDDKDVVELILAECGEKDLAGAMNGIDTGKVLAEMTNEARGLVNEPANHLTPTDMASFAHRLAKDFGLECEVLEGPRLMELGMGALLSVAQGSEQPPKFIVLTYRGNPASNKMMAWVGKGITFDSGGISLKPADNMDQMKGDMAGGAAVACALAACARLQLKINVSTIVAATENMPGGKASRPGDIVKAMNGKTIEIVNTDAEGRLTLADALSYAVKKGWSPLLDIATLTGACRIALGETCTGAFGNDKVWLDKVLKAADVAGECMWPLPTFDDYKELYKSSVADFKNSGGRFGGAITGALFVGEFAGNTPWVHLDIAGTSMTDKERGYQVKGGTGVGVRTLVTLAKMMSD
jgi:leucyl aminopeptidase